MFPIVCVEVLGDEFLQCDQIHYMPCNVSCGTGEQKAVTKMCDDPYTGMMEPCRIATATCNTVPCGEGTRVVIQL